MSESDSTDGPPSGNAKRLLMIGGAVALVLVLFAMTFSTILVVALRSDVSALGDQARKAAKETKALQEELAELKERLRSAQASAAASPRPSNIDAADPARDCVIRPGSKSGLSDCLAPAEK